MKIELEIDGQMIEGEFTLAEGAAQLSFGGATREAQVSEPEPGMFTVIINDRVFRCALEESPGGAVEVVVNGKRIPVAARQGVLVVEAMKMRNEVQSPKAGKIAEIKVSEGQTVNAGDVLAVIE